MNSGRATSDARQIGVIVLTIATAAIHLYWSTQQPEAGAIFIVNGIGYLTLLIALYLPLAGLGRLRGFSRWALIVYTAFTVLAWVLIGDRVVIAYLDKVIEVVLILLLLIGRSTRTPQPAS